MSSSGHRVLICGVGGHGVVRLGHTLVEVAHTYFPNVSLSENKGLSQRGGAVCVAIAMGNTIQTPTVQDAPVDILLSTDLLEISRNIHRLSECGWIASHNDFDIPAHLSNKPSQVQVTREHLSAAMEMQMNSIPRKMMLNLDLPNSGLSKCKARNAGLLGMACSLLKFEPGRLWTVFEQGIPSELRDVNYQHFQTAYRYANKIFRQFEEDMQVQAECGT